MAALSERGRKESNSELRSIIFNHTTDDSRGVLVDLGGGSGLLTEALADIYDQVLVLEPNLAKLEYGARRRPQVGFIRGSAQMIPVNGGGAGTVVSVAAFHHFPDQDAALEEIKRVLRPKGMLLLAEVDISTTRGKLLRFVENRLMGGGSRFITSSELRDKVERHGFVDIGQDRTSRGYVVIAKRGP